jgi:hypothetical protein
MSEEFRRRYPFCTVSVPERAFLAFIRTARSLGVGYGWMRQAIGMAWKLDDPVGYVDDARIVELYARPKVAPCVGCLLARETIDSSGFCVTCRALRERR